MFCCCDARALSLDSQPSANGARENVFDPWLGLPVLVLVLDVALAIRLLQPISVTVQSTVVSELCRMAMGELSWVFLRLSIFQESSARKLQVLQNASGVSSFV